MQYQIEIPSVFAFDHTMHRDIWGGDLIKEGKHLWTFRCNEDELAEITPKKIRLRKKILNENDRKRYSKTLNQSDSPVS